MKKIDCFRTCHSFAVRRSNWLWDAMGTTSVSLGFAELAAFSERAQPVIGEIVNADESTKELYEIACGIFSIWLGTRGWAAMAGLPVSVGILIASAIGVVRVVGFDGVTMIRQMYYGLDNFFLLAIPFFVIAGNIASRGETAERLVDVFRAFLGGIPGSLGIATIFACSFFAAISGTTFATILATGMITAGGTLGILIPPGIPMVLLSIAMGSSVSKQFTAGFVPGILMAVIWCSYVFFYARKHGLVEKQTYTWRDKRQALIKEIAVFIQTMIPNKILFLLVLNLFLAVCGFFLDVTPLVLILGPILSSTLAGYHVDFAQFGIICILNCQLGTMTPPFGTCLYLPMGTFKQPMHVVGRGELPFIITWFLFILLITYVPAISLFLPKLLGM